MQKKVFLGKGAKGGGGRPPYVKYLLWAILGLSVAIVVASYLLIPKSRETAMKTLPEKATVKKELPKPPEPAPAELPPAEKPVAGLAAKPEPAPEQPKQPEPVQKMETPPAPLPPAQPVQPIEPPVQVTRPPEPPPAPKDIFPKSPVAPSPPQKAQAPRPAGKMEKKAMVQPAKPGPAAPEQKAAKAAPKGGSFVVQVGCYKEKRSADEVIQKLRKKGYNVQVCGPGLTTGGTYAYTVTTGPVNKSKAYSLAEQLKAEKVSPTVVSAPAACGLDGAALKAAMKKPAAKPRVRPAPAATKSKAAATANAKSAATAKTVKKQEATARKSSKPASGKNAQPAASKTGTVPAKAVSAQ